MLTVPDSKTYYRVPLAPQDRVLRRQEGAEVETPSRTRIYRLWCLERSWSRGGVSPDHMTNFLKTDFERYV